MAKVLEFLSGKKTYLTGGAGLIVVGLHLFGIIPDSLAQTLYAGLGFTGAMTLRAGVQKSSL